MQQREPPAPGACQAGAAAVQQQQQQQRPHHHPHLVRQPVQLTVEVPLSLLLLLHLLEQRHRGLMEHLALARHQGARRLKGQ
jgi:hypothetical protein